MSLARAPRILITPLNWGLGHATRCLPLASAFAKTYGAEVSWASDGAALSLLRKERPTDSHHELPSYGVRYPTRSAYLNMLLSAPRMLVAIQQERAAVESLHREHAYDLILSDNRYGCRALGTANRFLTHQVHLPLSPSPLTSAAQALHTYLLGGFDALAVPDYPSAPRLAGQMSRPAKRLPTTYFGPVSRFLELPSALPPETYQTVLVLSGPEPARTTFESRLISQLRTFAPSVLGKTLLVRGLPQLAPPLEAHQIPDFLTVVPFLEAAALGPVLANAEVVVSRPGYTTVMDLAALQQRAIYVPTPGQPEQELLAISLAEEGRGVSYAEDQLVLVEAITQLRALPATEPCRPLTASLLNQWVTELGASLGWEALD